MVAGFTQNAFAQLPPLPLNLTGDPQQTTMALTGMMGNLASWTLRVANALNRLMPSGGPVPVSQGGTGLTSGISGGIPYFSSTSTMASSALLNSFEVVLGGGAGGAPFTPIGAGAFAAYLSFNAVTNLNTLSPPAGTVLQLADVDGNGSTIEVDAGAAIPRATFYRANTSLGAPTALAANDIFGSLNGQGHDGTSRSVSSALIRFVAVNTWTTTDHSNFIQFQAIPSTTTTVTTIAQLKAPADGGSQLIGTTAGDNATAGFDGEYISSVILVANEVNINAAANVAQLTNLPAGDWDVWGELWVDNSTGAATINTFVRAGITTTSATIPNTPSDATAFASYDSTPVTSSNRSVVLPVGPCRISQSSANTVYLVGIAPVSAGNAFGYGKIRARRIR